MIDSSSSAAMETDLATLLHDLSTVQDELFSVLAEKRQCMASRDLAGITELQVREESLGLRLATCHARRAELLDNAQTQGLPSDTLGNLAATFDREKQGNLREQVRDNAARMRLLQNESLTNWMLAQKSLLHLSQLLEIIATGGRLQPTYQRGESVLSHGALVDSEA